METQADRELDREVVRKLGYILPMLDKWMNSASTLHNMAAIADTSKLTPLVVDTIGDVLFNMPDYSRRVMEDALTAYLAVRDAIWDTDIVPETPDLIRWVVELRKELNLCLITVRTNLKNAVVCQP